MRWFRRKPPPPLVLEDSEDLEVLVEAPDAWVADSTVLAAAVERGVDLSAPLLVRHALVLPPEGVERAAELLAQDGYTLTLLDTVDSLVQVRAWRTQVLTALSASQERSRMAGLAQRLGGDVRGWDAGRPPAPAAAL